MDLRINQRAVIASSELREAFTRSTGPGGQNVNKVATKVELRWTPSTSAAFSDFQKEYLLKRLEKRLTDSGELIVTSNVHRTQIRNRAEARAKLVAIVQAALVRPKNRRATKPTRGSIKRRLEGKKRRSSIKKSRRRSGHEE